ncbi:Protein transport protein yif1 [Psilocybe cubensis]|uniref:Protein transport protein yif1 n=2 Tax=Psilocybe cubensis TaxID=181762 RepID=A0ACB8GKB3_PSICU|nr:Protein transport protein yif1 [Psilocybe cubensis]KAH9475837.1 Protein transport protein yif1 [Psilocybe cubensis]
MSQFNSHSPPPLRHPVPTHPAYIPEPPSTPASPQGYQRFSSSPGPGQPQQQQSYPSHVPAYTSPFQHSQPPIPPQYQTGMNMHHMQPQTQQQHPLPPQQNAHMSGPDYAAWGFDGATAQLGMQLGQSAVAAGQEYVQRNFGTIIPSYHIKHYFNVSNSYVIKKLRLLLFPWMHKTYFRRPRAQGEWLPPRNDINSPDLYIPVMAVFTYILLTTLNSGINSKFSPLVLGESASRSTAVLLLDFCFVRLGCYILNIQGSSQVMDLIAYGGYKFVGVIFTLAAGFLGVKGPLWTMVFLYAFAGYAFFLLRSLRAVILPDPASVPATHATATVTQAQRRRRIIFLLLEALMQILYMGWLVRI